MPSNVRRSDRPSLAEYRRRLLAWYGRAARDLPWRRDPTPYAVWVSEIMLQQTRVEAVIPYFERFLKRFPDMGALASASEEEVLEAWSGLGYYRRARLLHAGVREVLERHEGEFPRTEGEALAIPGIGRYTAGAIRSIALGERAPVVDGNVTRVLARVFGIRGDVSRAAVARELWAIAGEAVTRGDPSATNQAQMELGALVCRPKNPACDACPLATLCVARERGLVEELPELPARRKPVDVRRSVLLVRAGTRVLLRRRRDDELLPGLWDLPGAFTGRAPDGQASDRSGDIEDALALLPFPAQPGPTLGTLRHAVTHRRILLEIVECVPSPDAAARADDGSGAPVRRALRGPDGAELAWHALDSADARALSSPARRILARFANAPVQLAADLDSGNGPPVS